MALTSDECGRLEEYIAAISDSRGHLKPHERDFLDDIEARYDDLGADLHLTPRQWAWLDSLFDRA